MDEQTKHVQWDAVSKASGANGDKSDYLRLESGRKYRIRPIFSPVKFYKYFHKKDDRLRTGICGNPDTCPVRDRHPELKKPSLRFAAYVIDREDSKVKILEAPQSVFRPIGSSFEMTGKNPGGGKDGSDWGIKVTGKGLATKYDVMFIENTPLTQDERATVKETLDGDQQKLTKLYKVDTPEELEQKLFGDLDAKEQIPDSPPKATENATLEDNTSKSASDDGDDFDNNW